MAGVGHQSPNIFVVSGTSGVGKTTVARAIRAMAQQTVTVRDLDAYLPNVKQDSRWRRSAYEAFFQEATNAPDRVWILIGQILLAEFVEIARQESGCTQIRLAVLEVSGDELLNRLRARGWTAEQIAEQARWVEERFRPALEDVHFRSVDTDAFSPNELARDLLSWIAQQLGVPMADQSVSPQPRSMSTWPTRLPEAKSFSDIVKVVTADPAADYFDIYHPVPFSEMNSLRTAVDKQEFSRKAQVVLEAILKNALNSGRALAECTVLDVGANAGGLSARLAQAGLNVHALDISSSYVSLGEAVARVSKLPVQWRHGALATAIVDDEKYDFGVLLSVFQWAADGGDKLDEAGRDLYRLSCHCNAMIFEIGYNMGTKCLRTDSKDHYREALKLLLSYTTYSDFKLLSVTQLYPGQDRYIILCRGHRETIL